jgi:hypothetical protein
LRRIDTFSITLRLFFFKVVEPDQVVRRGFQWIIDNKTAVATRLQVSKPNNE